MKPLFLSPSVRRQYHAAQRMGGYWRRMLETPLNTGSKMPELFAAPLNWPAGSASPKGNWLAQELRRHRSANYQTGVRPRAQIDPAAAPRLSQALEYGARAPWRGP